MTVLGVDVGTTSLKMAVFREVGDSLEIVTTFSKPYLMNTYNEGLFSDIEPAKWLATFELGCREMGDILADVDVIALSGTTPALTAMDSDGGALYPAILMLDQRSRKQAQQIINTIGLDTLLQETGNMPVAGGCSLASMLWIRDNHPDIFEKTAVFGHSNTFMARYLTGNFAIDPSSASLTALYNTVKNDLTWNTGIASEFGLTEDRLPHLIPAMESAGRVEASLALRLGLRKEPPVVIGGNDAVLAAYSLGITEPGQVIDVNGTCEITLVCLPKCLSSTHYNVRAHVVPDRWLTLYVMNAGGYALEWFRKLFCTEIAADDFYSDFLPAAVNKWLDRESSVAYIPFLMGSRYSLEPLRAEFTGITAETSRDELAASLVRGLCNYQQEHLDLIEKNVPLNKTVCLTGGAVNPALVRAKEHWYRDCKYEFQEQSSVLGAAMLGMDYLKK